MAKKAEGFLQVIRPPRFVLTEGGSGMRCVGLEHRVWPVVGAGHKQLKPLACFRARVVVWGSGGLGYRVWPVVGAGHSSGLSFTLVLGGG